MTTNFDVIIVGSGPAGVSAAFPLVEAGLRVLMVDGGKQPDVPPPDRDFLSARTHDTAQWKWMIGKNFHALKRQNAASPKLRVPTQAYAFDGFKFNNKIEAEDFIAMGSLARGGLSNTWDCGVARLSTSELSAFPFSNSDITASYEKVSRRIGISGRSDDDMSDYFGLDEFAQSPIPMDKLHTWLADRYAAKRLKLHAQGFKLGRSRVAALNTDISGRQGCNLSNNCLWGCSRRSLYSAVHDLPALHQHDNFNELPGFVVDNLNQNGDFWTVAGQTERKRQSITCSKVILAAGTLATTRIVLNALNLQYPIPLLSNPTASFLLCIPRFFGAQQLPGFGLGQLSFVMNLRNSISAFGSTFSTTGIPISNFTRYIPMRRRYGIDLLSSLLSSCVIGNLSLPGQLTQAQVQLSGDGALAVFGQHDDNVRTLMSEAGRKLISAYWSMGALMLPGSFSIGQPGSDIHYAGTLPMRTHSVTGETSPHGEVTGMPSVYVVDGACLPVFSEKSHTLTIMANADRIGTLIAANFWS